MQRVRPKVQNSYQQLFTYYCRIMKFEIFLLALAVSLTAAQNSTAPVCHYSCGTCVGESYTLCTACNDTSRNITVVEDPSVSQLDYINSNTVSGACVGQVEPKANPLGIIMLLICMGIVAAVRTPGSIYLISMLQTIGLISFVEVAWVNPVGFLLQSLQYFMIFSWVGSGYKVQDQALRERQYYRLDVYLHQSKFLFNIALVGIVNIILLGCVVILLIYRAIKNNRENEQKYANEIVSQKSEKFSMKEEIEPSQTDREEKSVTQYIKDPGVNILQFVLNCFLVFFYFCIQETSLMIVTSLRFQRPLPASTIALSVIYVIILLLYLMYLYVNPLFFYPNKKSQFVNIWKKIGLPVLVIVPYQINYILLVFMLAFAIVQSSVDYNGGKIKLLTRMTLYKILDLLTIFMAGIYIIVEFNNNLELPTNIIRIFLAICILSFFICLFIELFFGIIETYCLKNNEIKNQTEVNEPLPVNVTDETINQNIFDNPNTRANTKNNLQIFIQDINDKNTASYQNSPMNANFNGLQVINTGGDDQETKRQKQREKEQAQKREAEQRVRKQAEERAKKQAEERAKKEAEDRARKEAEERAKKQVQLKNKLQADLKAKKQSEQKARKQAQQRARKKKQQEERKKREAEEAQKKRKQLEEQQRARKAAEQEARLKKEQEQKERKEAEEAARRKKQQQEDQQAQQRARKKRQYIAQMDPALRKRYGF